MLVDFLYYSLKHFLTKGVEYEENNINYYDDSACTRAFDRSSSKDL